MNKQFKRLATVMPRSRYVSHGIGYYPKLKNKEDRRQESIGIVDIHETSDGMLYTFHGDIHDSKKKEQTSVLYKKNGTIVSNCTRGSKRTGTWKVKSNNDIELITNGKDAYGVAEKKKVIISNVNGIIHISSFNINGDGSLKDQSGSEVCKPYTRVFDCCTHGNIKVEKHKDNDNIFYLTLHDVDDFTVSQEDSEDTTLNNDRVVVSQTPKQWFNDNFKNNNYNPTATLRYNIPTGKAVVVFVVQSAKLNDNGDVVLTCKQIKPKNKNNIILTEGEYQNVVLNTGIKNHKSISDKHKYKTTIFSNTPTNNYQDENRKLAVQLANKNNNSL